MSARNQTTLRAAGAGFCLADAKGREGAAMLRSDIRTDERDGETVAAGPGEHWGDPVTVSGVAGGNVAFDPAYVCALYIRYEANGRPSIRHAYKALIGPKTDEAIRDTAEYVLKDLRNDKYHPDVVHVRRNFTKFTMNSQQVVVLFLDNDPAIIRFNDDGELATLVRFTPFGGYPPYEDRRQNHAFYNLQRLPLTKGEFDCNTAFRLDFWNTDETGQPLQIDAATPEAEHYIYSMNIHLLQAPYEPDQVATIPVILDPDTGNGGAEP